MRGVRRSGFRRGVLLSSLVVLSLLAVMLSVPFPSPAMRERDAAVPATNHVRHGILDTFDSIGGYFIENRGQVNGLDRYYSTGNPSVAFRDDGVMFVVSEHIDTPMQRSREWGDRQHLLPTHNQENASTKSVAYLLRFENANRVAPVGRGRLPFNSNYFIGNDPSKWRTDVPNYASVAYEDLYDGIDLVYSSNANGVKYEFIVKPGADPAAIEIRYEGIESLRPEGDELAVRHGLGVMFDSPPYSYAEGGVEVSCRFGLRGPASHGFDCEGWDSSKSLIIDPLIYSTYLGGMDNQELGWSIAVDSSGNAFVTGQTRSTDFPTTTGAYDNILTGPEDAFIIKLNATGTGLIYATFLGGSVYDVGDSIAVDPSGNAYVMGGTSSLDFPITVPTFDSTPNGYYDYFVAELNPRGNFLLFSTYLGGVNSESWPCAIAASLPGTVYVTGVTGSPDFPNTTGAFDETCGTDGKCNFDGRVYKPDAFVAKLITTTGELSYSTFLGGGDEEWGWSVAVDSSGSAYVTGYTNSSDFPSTSGAYDRLRNVWHDAFVAKLNPAGSDLSYSTYIGGGSNESASSIALDSSGNAYIAGWTASTDFPTTAGALDTSHNGDRDGFVLKLNETGGSLLYSTFLGGEFYDEPYSIALDSYGYAYVTGLTESADFPIGPAPYSRILGGPADAFVTKLDSTGDNILYSTYFGGSDSDVGMSIALDSLGNIYITGWTDSRDFPITPDAYDTTLDVGFDVFVSKINGALAVTLETSPVNLDIVVDGAANRAPYTLWCPIGSSHTLDAPSPQLANSTRYAFMSWSDGGAQSHSIDCYSVSTKTASFAVVEYDIALNTSPVGLEVIVDGDSHTAPFSFWCAAGTPHELGTPSPQTVASASHSFVSWSDGGAQLHSITCDAPATYTANFTEIVSREFTVSAFPTSRTVSPGGTTLFAVTVTAVGDYDGSAVTVRVVNPPSGFSAECSPISVTPTDSCLLTVSVAISSSPGTYTLSVEGGNGTATRDTQIALSVTELPDFDLQVSPTLIEIEVGKSGTTTVTVTPIANYSGRVVITANGVPTGSGVHFSPANIIGFGTSQLTFIVSSDASPGMYEVFVTGIDGDLRHNVSIQLIILLPRPPDTGQFPLWILLLILALLMAVPVVALYLERRHDKKERREDAKDKAKKEGNR